MLMKKLILLLLFLVCYTMNLNAQNQPLPSRAYDWKTIPEEKTSIGEQRRFLDGPTKTLEHFEIYATRLAPGKISHKSRVYADREELILVKEGKVGITINNQEKGLGPGSIVLAAAGDERGMYNAGPDTASYYMIRWKSKIPVNPERSRTNGGSAFFDYTDMKFEENPKGGRRNVTQRPTATLKELEMHITTLEEGMTSHPPHTHVDEEIIVVLKGEVEEMINGSPYHLGTGSVIFLSSMDPHGIRNAGKGACEYYAIRWVSTPD